MKYKPNMVQKKQNRAWVLLCTCFFFIPAGTYTKCLIGGNDPDGVDGRIDVCFVIQVSGKQERREISHGCSIQDDVFKRDSNPVLS